MTNMTLKEARKVASAANDFTAADWKAKRYEIRCAFRALADSKAKTASQRTKDFKMADAIKGYVGRVAGRRKVSNMTKGLKS